MNDSLSSPELRERYDAAVSELVAGRTEVALVDYCPYCGRYFGDPWSMAYHDCKGHTTDETDETIEELREDREALTEKMMRRTPTWEHRTGAPGRKYRRRSMLSGLS